MSYLLAVLEGSLELSGLETFIRFVIFFLIVAIIGAFI